MLSFQNEYIDSEWSATLISHLLRGIVLNAIICFSKLKTNPSNDKNKFITFNEW